MVDQLIDLNHATAEELQSLPGIGEVLAERIIAARPLKSVDDLAEIDGIRPALVEQLRPLVTVTPIEAKSTDEAENAEETEEPTPAEQAEADTSVEAEEELASPEVEDESASSEEEPQPEEHSEEPSTPPTAEDKPEPTAQPPEPKYISRREAWLMTLVTSAVAFLLAILMTLGVLQSINGTLHYGSAISQQGLNRQISVVQSEIGQIQQNIDSLQGQISDLQNVAQKVEKLSDNQQTLQQQIEEMNTTLEKIKSEAQTASKFLVGMRDLLNGLMPPPTPTATPEATATPTATPQP